MNTVFWNSKNGSFLLVVLVVTPSAFFLRSGNLILLGLTFSLLLSWISLKLQHKTWHDMGLRKPGSISKILLAVIGFLIFIMPVSYLLRHYITILTQEHPNLEAFNAVKGNLAALMIGLCIAWIFGAFGEELLFRGFLLNSIYNLFPRTLNFRLKVNLALLISSLFTGIGHAYQGLTGMVLTGLMGLFFGLLYLKSKHNLWSSILAHGFYDTVAIVFLFFDFHLDDVIKI